MNTYEIIWASNPEQIVAKSPGQAKYRHFCELREVVDTFQNYLHGVDSVHLLHKFRVADLFGDPERFTHMITQRGIEFAYQGMRVSVCGKMGTICGTCGLNLAVCFDGNPYSENCHPYWKTIYYDKQGNIIKSFVEGDITQVTK
ncbi:MAG: hypothetical protein A2020_12285 [Lentisphaerae bacterium GWF2_45_14]|nr:MAG: hypothetical protein A2020_12285 [Lentisphaerae bacterium GWF2_45_14]